VRGVTGIGRGAGGVLVSGAVTTELDVPLRDRRTAHVHDCGADATPVTVVWHHGTPQIGTPPPPFVAATPRLRWVGYDRPGYDRTARQPGRSIASAAADVGDIADALGIDRFAVVGHSGGSPHALACAALLPERVLAVVCFAGMAPFDAEGLDWFAGMHPAGAGELRASTDGAAALEALLAATEFDATQFTPTDHAALQREWAFLGTSAGQATSNGIGGLVDDDLAYVRPWGFAVEQVTAPVLLIHGDADQIIPLAHSQWLAEHLPDAELRVRPDDGHLSVLDGGVDAVAWILEQAT